MIKKSLYSLSILVLTLCNYAVLRAQELPGTRESFNDGLKFVKYLHSDPIVARVDSIMKQMSLEEKVGQLNHLTGGYKPDTASGGKALEKQIADGMVGALTESSSIATLIKFQKIAVEESRLHIPLLFAEDVLHGFRTIFPVPIAQACSWDLAAIEKADHIAAMESCAAGINWTFAPMVDISRDPRWGRVMEGAGEDTYLGSCIAKARVRGFQGDNLGDGNSIMACVKHFAAYGAPEGGREYNTVDISERVLREVYLPPYKAAVDAGSASIMNSFNVVDRIPASCNKHLMTDIARGEWGFKGFFVSDAFSYFELIPFGVAANKKDAAALSMNAGGDMDLWSEIFVQNLPELVKEGKVSESQINASVKRILYYKFKMGLFDNPYRYLSQKRKDETLLKPEFKEASREIARKTIVLLKNDKRLLPLSKNYKTIALIGSLADSRENNNMVGNWSCDTKRKDIVTLYDGLKEIFPATQIVKSEGSKAFGNCPDNMINTAVAVAEQADIVILAVGEEGYSSGECASRVDLSLPGDQEKLIEALAKTGKPIVAVIFAGRPLVLTPVIDKLQAILYVWQPGTMGGLAIADILSGAYNPSGKITMTFPRHQGQIPIYYNQLAVGRERLGPEDKRWGVSKWSDEINEPLFPFGYGLSYTSFAYSNLKLSKTAIDNMDSLIVNVDVKNTGDIDGEEVVQLYVHDLVGSVVRPLKELKGFRKIMLQKGESKTISFTIHPADLAFYTIDMSYKTEPGDFKVYVSSSSEGGLEAGFVLK
ncbi:MAG: glycoside hydrolase family 3 N-terminal domain-containing protein [Ginsengibacter sp.]